MYQALADVQIIEAASFVAGPYCGLMLAQLGAEVIRLDPVQGGPDYRRWPVAPNGASLYWEGLNRGKKSIAVNLQTAEGRELAQALAAAPGPGRGLFVTNYPEEGFFAHEKIASRRADVITLRIQGRADGSSAVDYTVNCAVGLPYMTGPAELPDTPVNHVLPAWDLLAGSTAALSLLAALDARRRGGHGQHIRVPLSDIAAATLGHLGQIAEVMITGADRPKGGNTLYGAFGRDFLTADGTRLMIVAITPRQWQGLVAALGLGSAVAALEAELNLSFAIEEGNRYRHRDRLEPLVAAAVAALSLAELEQRFASHAVCYGPYRSLGQAVAQDPGFVSANPVFTLSDNPSGHAYPAPGFAAHFCGEPRLAPGTAPRLGQHTDQVLAEVLGLPGGAIAALHDRGIVA